MTDPIADMLTRIKNASAVKKAEVAIPFSKIKYSIAQILEKEGYVREIKKIDENYGQIIIVLKYENNESAIKSMKRISKAGRRVYVGKDKIPNVLNDLGIAILSTSKGLMTNKEARKKEVGGEVLCEIY